MLLCSKVFLLSGFRSGEVNIGEIRFSPTKSHTAQVSGSHVSEVDYELDVSHSHLTSVPSSNTVLFTDVSVTTNINPGIHIAYTQVYT